MKRVRIISQMQCEALSGEPMVGKRNFEGTPDYSYCLKFSHGNLLSQKIPMAISTRTRLFAAECPATYFNAPLERGPDFRTANAWKTETFACIYRGFITEKECSSGEYDGSFESGPSARWCRVDKNGFFDKDHLVYLIRTEKGEGMTSANSKSQPASQSHASRKDSGQGSHGK